MALDHETFMRLAMQEAELARGATGDNPWVGCVIVSPEGEVLGKGHTQGPGEDHAEIAAARAVNARGLSVAGTTLYSTLEPCSFHSRTPACSRVIVERRPACVVIGMRDPHPRVDGVGVRILRDGDIAVIEGVCEAEVRRQLGSWVLTYHPHDVLRRAQALGLPGAECARALAEVYAVPAARVAEVLARR